MCHNTAIEFVNKKIKELTSRLEFERCMQPRDALNYLKSASEKFHSASTDAAKQEVLNTIDAYVAEIENME